MKKLLVTAGVAGLLLTGAATATADPSPDRGCHGYYTTGYHEGGGNTGEAIGGRGRSDDDPTNGQAHQDPGRGEQVQAFLGTACGVGRERP